MNWWLKLYTIPAMKTSLLLMMAAFFLNAVCAMFVGVSIPVLYLLSGCLFGLLQITSTNSFRVNMEFHKMSIPYRELQRAFVFHSFIVYFFILSCFAFFYFLSYMAGFFVSEVLVLSPVLVIASVFCGFFVWVFAQIYLTYEKRYTILTKDQSFLQRFLLSCLIYFLLSFMFILLTFLDFSHLMFIPMLVLVIIFPMGWYAFRAMFHQTSEEMSFFKGLKFNLLGVLSAFTIYFMFAFVGQMDVTNYNLSTEQRYQAFQAWYPIIDKLDRVTFKEFESHASGDIEIFDLYQKVDRDELKSIPAHYFIDNKNPQRLYSFLAYAKEIHPNQLTFIFDHFVQHKGYWKDPKKAEHFYHMAIYRWPADQKFPERHLAAQEKWNQMQHKRKMASEQKVK